MGECGIRVLSWQGLSAHPHEAQTLLKVQHLLGIHDAPALPALVDVRERELRHPEVEDVDAALVHALELREDRVQAAQPATEQLVHHVHVVVRGRELREGLLAEWLLRLLEQNK